MRVATLALLLLTVAGCCLELIDSFNPLATKLTSHSVKAVQPRRPASARSRLHLYTNFDYLHAGKDLFDSFIEGKDVILDMLRHSLADGNIAAGADAVSGAIAEETKSLDPLGNDLLIFLCATIGIVPLFKQLNASPVLGFLTAGLVMGPAGLKLFSDLGDMQALADFGVLFLLFEQGLELTVERLKALSRFAFGMGTLQVLLTTVAFFTFPFVGGVEFLERIVRSDPSLVEITRFDEAFVVGAALSLSSSAFVLKILQEKNQLSSRYGSAALGILLLQDIAVVPLLVLLPIIETSGASVSLNDQLMLVGATFLKAFLGLGGILLVGGTVVRALFSVVATSKSSETFVALCLLVALGTGALTDALGLSSTLGAFTAGTLLAESNYRTQIETDIKPFRGLLLGLFFLTTGASVEPTVIQQEWPTVLALLGGLVIFKAVIITLLGPLFKLSKSESVRTGLLLSGGGEFAFVVLTLADKLDVIPNQLAKILVGVVVLSMALTPTLSKVGDFMAGYIEAEERRNIIELTFGVDGERAAMTDGFKEEDNKDAIVICGYDNFGETVTKFLQSTQQNFNEQPKYIAFDLDPELVIKGYKAGKKVLYGDGSQPMVLSTAGVDSPRAFVVTYEESETCIKAVERIREAFPDIPIFARANNVEDYFHILEAGATTALSDDREASLKMGSDLVSFLGMESANVKQLRDAIRNELSTADSVYMENSLMKKRVDAQGRTKSQELPMKIANSMPFNQIKPAIAEAKQTVANIIETFEDEYLNIEEVQTSEDEIVYEESDLKIEELGVTVCILPPKRDQQSSNTTALPEEVKKQ